MDSKKIVWLKKDESSYGIEEANNIPTAIWSKKKMWEEINCTDNINIFVYYY